MNKEIEFFIKVIRNAAILSGMYFVSVWAVGDLSWALCKPVLVFMLTYIFTELARFYKLETSNKTTNLTTLIL